jgi:hypothetical protein
MNALRLARTILPFIVSGGILGYLLSAVDFAPVLDRVTLRGSLTLAFALVAFGFVSLLIEGQCLHRLMPADGPRETRWTLMRMKSASYLLSTVNVALGAGALAYLLQRRSKIGLGDAAGIVVLLSAFDLCVLLWLGAAATLGMATQTLALPVGSLVAMAAAVFAGLAIVRSSISLGPLERYRELSLLRAARLTPAASLAEAFALRMTLVAGFLCVFWSGLLAFGIDIPIGPLVAGMIAVTLVSSLPIGVSGLGTGQATFIICFSQWADEGTLVATSLALTLGMILLRGGIGLAFAGEFSRVAIAAARHSDAETR